MVKDVLPKRYMVGLQSPKPAHDKKHHEKEYTAADAAAAAKRWAEDFWAIAGLSTHAVVAVQEWEGPRERFRLVPILGPQMSVTRLP